jgi:prepilin-type processing-associated H-X9-DG protein/prepilin-type N-terminal cleavage/methylation domain-containing protein
MNSHRDKICLRASRRCAFTLVELLVAIAIMAIVAALVLTNVARAKLAAQRVTCINNLKQWAGAAHLYAHDNEDRLPREAAVDGINSWEITGASTNSGVWYNALAETAGIPGMLYYAQTPSSQQEFYSGNIFHCPRARFAAVAATYPNFSLAMNSKLMLDFEVPWYPAPTAAGPLATWVCKLTGIKAPDRTALFLDNGIPGEEKLCVFQPPYTGQPKACASEFAGRHNGGGNIAFVDGHVATLPGRDVVEMDPASLFRGRGIFPPAEVVWCPDPAWVP